MSVMQSNPSRETGNPLVDGMTKVFLRLGRLVERLLPSEPPKRPPDMTDAELAGLAAVDPSSAELVLLADQPDVPASVIRGAHGGPPPEPRASPPRPVP